MSKILILGGTAEAVALAAAVAAEFGEGFDIQTSLAGRTKSPTVPVGAVRVGGFGGPKGLTRYLREQGFNAVIDATHPFAARMTGNAVEACAAAGVPRLRLDRPAWARSSDDDWYPVADLAAAATALPQLGRRALLTIGSQELRAFRNVRDVRFWARMIEPALPEDLPADCTVLTGRGPFDQASEEALMRRYGIDILVTKNSGGDAAAAKLAAARSLNIPVVMVARPPVPPGETVQDVAAAVTWLRQMLR